MRRFLLLVGLSTLAVLGACGEDSDEGDAARDTLGVPATTSVDAESTCIGQVIVFLQPEQTDAGAEALGAEIEVMAAVDDLAVVGHEEAFKEFQELFADTPDVVETVTADMVPPSVRVRAEDDSTASRLGASYEDDPRVSEVVLAGDLTRNTDEPNRFCSPPADGE